MSIKQEILGNFENDFGLSGLKSKPLEYSNLSNDEFDRVKSFLSSSIDRILEKVKECVPEEEHMTGSLGYQGILMGITSFEAPGEKDFNRCRSQFLDNLKKL